MTGGIGRQGHELFHLMEDGFVCALHALECFCCALSLFQFHVSYRGFTLVRWEHTAEVHDLRDQHVYKRFVLVRDCTGFFESARHVLVGKRDCRVLTNVTGHSG